MGLPGQSGGTAPPGADSHKYPERGGGLRGREGQLPRAEAARAAAGPLTDVVVHPQRSPQPDAGRDGFIHQLLDALQRSVRTASLAAPHRRSRAAPRAAGTHLHPDGAQHLPLLPLPRADVPPAEVIVPRQQLLDAPRRLAAAPPLLLPARAPRRRPQVPRRPAGRQPPPPAPAALHDPANTTPPPPSGTTLCGRGGRCGAAPAASANGEERRCRARPASPPPDPHAPGRVDPTRSALTPLRPRGDAEMAGLCVALRPGAVGADKERFIPPGALCASLRRGQGCTAPGRTTDGHLVCNSAGLQRATTASIFS